MRPNGQPKREIYTIERNRPAFVSRGGGGGGGACGAFLLGLGFGLNFVRRQDHHWDRWDAPGR